MGKWYRFIGGCGTSVWNACTVAALTISFVAMIASIGCQAIDVGLSTTPFDHCAHLSTATVEVNKTDDETDTFVYEFDFDDGLYTESAILETGTTNLYAPICDIGCYKVDLSIHSAEGTGKWNFSDVCVLEAIEKVDLESYSIYNPETPSIILPFGATLLFRASVNVSEASIFLYRWEFSSPALWIPITGTTTEPAFSLAEYPPSEGHAITVVVENQLYAVAETRNLILTEGVGRTVSLVDSGPVGLGDVMLFEYFTNRVSATYAIIFDADLGDGNHVGLEDYVDVTEEDSDPKFKFSFSHTYLDAGSYTVTVTAVNDASSISVSNVVYCATITVQAYWPHGGSFSESDIGETFESPLVFNVTTFNNSVPLSVFKSFKWTIEGPHFAQIVTTAPSLEHVFQGEGVFDVNATAVSHSGVDVTRATFTARVVDSIAALYLINDSPAEVGGSVTFVLFTSRVGTDATYSANLGDGSSLQLSLPSEVNDISSFVPPTTNLIFLPQEKFAVVFHHTYASKGTFTASVSASNELNHRAAFSDVFILTEACDPPTVRIGENSEDPSAVASYQADMFIVQTANVWTSTCYGSGEIALEWTAHLITNRTTLPGPSNQRPFAAPIETSRANLVIPPYGLNPGLYFLKLTVTIIDQATGSSIVHNSDQTLVRISPLLVAKIEGGSSRTVGLTSAISIDAQKSHDPDPTDDGSMLQFRWYCRTMDDPPFPGPITLSHLANTGGCFGNGNFLSDHTSSVVVVDDRSLDILVSYVFRLEVHKPPRVAGVAEQTIRVVPGSPPLLQIRCLHNCDRKVNPSTKFVLTAHCADCAGDPTVRYMWGLYDSGDVAVTGVDFGERTLHGGSSKHLFFKPYALANLTEGTYTARLLVSAKGRAEGGAEYSFSINRLPAVGSCSVTPSHGYVLDTQYAIRCTGFSDEDSPLTYTFLAVTGAGKETTITLLETEQQAGSLLYFGQQPSVESTYLPTGVAERDYRVDIVVTVSDIYGASVQVQTSTTVYETPGEPGEILDRLSDLIDGEDSLLQRLSEYSDTQSMTQLLTMASSTLQNLTCSELGPEYVLSSGEIRTTIVTSLSAMPVDSNEMLQQVSSAMNLATQDMTWFSEQTQLATVNVFVELARALKSTSEKSPERAVANSALALGACLSNAIGALGRSAMEGSCSGDADDGDSDDEMRRNVTLTVLGALGDIQSAMAANRVVAEPVTVLVTPAFSAAWDRLEAGDLDGAAFRDNETGIRYQFPVNGSLSHSLPENYTDAVDLQSYFMPFNPFAWDSTGEKIHDGIIGLRMKLPNDLEVEVEDLSSDIEVFLPQTAVETQSSSVVVDSTNATLRSDFTVDALGTSVLISVETDEADLTFQFYVRYGAAPSPTEFDETIALPAAVNGACDQGDSCLWFLSSGYLNKMGTYRILVILDGVLHDESAAVTMAMYTADCLYWDDKAEAWLRDGCTAGPLTTSSSIHCLCNHLSVFGGSMSALPSTVDVEDTVDFITPIVESPVMLSTLACVFAAYCTLAVWSLRQDRVDRSQAKICVLEDNDPRSSHCYGITVHTGYRRGAGTSANVVLTLHGKDGKSEPHVLRDASRSVLQRGDTDTFLLTTTQSLGNIEAIRLWHDNSGNSPEWFVSDVIVQDLETELRWYFLCNTWLVADDVGSGLIDRVFGKASVDDLKKFEPFFVTMVASGLRDRHLWVSVLGRPARSHFTRFQRLTCVLSLVTCSMLANLLFYRVMNDGSDKLNWRVPVIGIASSAVVWPINTAIVQIFRFLEPKKRETATSDADTESSLYDQASSQRTIDIDTPPSSGPQPHPSESEEHTSASSAASGPSQKSSQESGSDWTDFSSEASFFSTSYASTAESLRELSANEFIVLTLNQFREDCAGALLERKEAPTRQEYKHYDVNLEVLLKVMNITQTPDVATLPGMEDYADVVAAKGRRSFRIVLSWRFYYVAWLLLVATTSISTYYLILHSIEYGEAQSIHWLMSVCTSIFQSIVVEQPALVLFVALFFALFVKDLDDGEICPEDFDEALTQAVYFDSLDMAVEYVSRIRQEEVYMPPHQKTL